jgi:hypothetical protein
LRTSATTERARLPHDEQALLGRLGLRMSRENLDIKMRRIMLLLLVIANLATIPVLATAQAMADSRDSSGTVASKGVFPRLHYAVISTLTARRGEDGHRVFSFLALVAQYAGTMTAFYSWYPGRYDGKDALWMDNYTLLGYVGGNIALEFLHGGPQSMLSRRHLNNGNGAPNPGSNP